MVCVVHHFKGKLLLPEESAAQQQPDSTLLNVGPIDSTMEKYLSSQVSVASEPADHMTICFLPPQESESDVVLMQCDGMNVSNCLYARRIFGTRAGDVFSEI